jgi:predicted nucleotidyltransferase
MDGVLDPSRPDAPALVPAALLDPVVAYFNPRRVILFGSAARGLAGPDSDIDLLVVVDDDTPADRLTLRAGYEARRSYRQPADVIPVRESTFRENAGIAGTLSRAAVLDGVIVYERP